MWEFTNKLSEIIAHVSIEKLMWLLEKLYRQQCASTMI
jgi:hypothetical protein